MTIKQIPKLLQELHTYLKDVINLELINEKTLTWKYSNDVYSMCIHTRSSSLKKKRQQELLLEGQKFLSPLAKNKCCRRMIPKWTNTGYCPDESPIGKYVWSFQCRMIQELLWLYPEFIDGFLYGRDGKKRKRDANPYSDISRKASWDSGYILGLSEPKVGEWLGERLEEKP